MVEILAGECPICGMLPVLGIWMAKRNVFGERGFAVWIPSATQVPSLLSSQEYGPEMETTCFSLWVGDEVSLLAQQYASASGRA